MNDEPIQVWPVFGFEIPPDPDPYLTTAESRGQIIFDITWMEPDPPSRVNVRFTAYAGASLTGGAVPWEVTAADGFGDPFIMTTQSGGNSHGVHDKILTLDNSGHVRFVVQQFARIVWGAEDAEITNGCDAEILPCD